MSIPLKESSKGYQFCIDGRPAGRVRKEWKEAAQDAVTAGYAQWKVPGVEVILASNEGAEIDRL
jgi:hypothetical protein